ncbi:MAG: DNA mismatch repair protein MutS [Oscillospiraceae bacterium]|jgi:DNA mismatch repair protein MutS|nr:DNA mismatch repair protein MutS [Oscillospiraceae bacterium]
MAEMTPMMKQYFNVKEQYPDTILLFRLGDFYEMFFEDAKLASKVLDLVLTGRDCGQEERAPMCGVPYHSADSYIAKLVSCGYKVAICEQTQDPAEAKGLVRREVIRIITPGTVIESNMLDEAKNNYLACLSIFAEKAGVCFIDVSTGQVHLTEFEGKNINEKVIGELVRFGPREVIMNGEAIDKQQLKAFFAKGEGLNMEVLDEEEFLEEKCDQTVLKHFHLNDIQSLAQGITKHGVIALGAALNYLYKVQKTDLGNVYEVDFYSDAKFMRLDSATRRNLELTETMLTREKRGSLLWVLDKTKTAMGKRLMRSFIEQPLVSCAQIMKRQNAVEELVQNSQLREESIELMSGIHDIERLMTRISYGSANARELRSLAQTIEVIKPIKDRLQNCSSNKLCELMNDMDPLTDVLDVIERSIVEDPPFTVREGGMIKDGFNEELNYLKMIVNDGKGFIAGIQEREQERTGIKKLKIGYNRVFGYYIEITNSYKALVPDDYIRKQTLTNCERYITQELKDLESKVLSAQEKMAHLEYEIFNTVRLSVAAELIRIQKTAHALAQLDVFCSLAKVAVSNNYICPHINDSDIIELKDARHPVVELMLDLPFVPNDTLLDCGENTAATITGPNMAGKSTYIRQVAVIAIMAQIGSFVPAYSATMGIIDGVYTRIGACDDLSSGQSTFMVEMSEVANILNNASKKSLIILDEIGRGTSTFDGMSIAQAVLEFVCDPKKLGAKTLFATHYHELTEMEGQVRGIKNYNISCKKRGDDIIFLRRIVRGGADGSYGIEVAKLAGVPKAVVNRAKVILQELETCGDSVSSKTRPKIRDDMQISMQSNQNDEIADQLKSLDVNTLTPIEALAKLYDLVKQANG